MKRIYFQISLVFLSMASCSGQDRDRGEEAMQVVGTWRLNLIGEEVPSSIGLNSHEMTIHPDGTWTGRSTMFGTTVEFGGKWSIDKDGAIEYTAGDNSGKTRFNLENQSLVLHRDFVLAGDRKTTYQRKN